MPLTNFKRIFALLSAGLIATTSLTACSKQNWYQGMQSAQTADCMKQPLADYDDCTQQTNESYQEYQKKEKLVKE